MFVANVNKWEKTVSDDEKELEKLKKDEQKQIKVRHLKPPFLGYILTIIITFSLATV